MPAQLKSDKEDKETVFTLLDDDDVLVRMEDQNGETPLHKLARFVVPDDKIEAFKLVRATRDPSAVPIRMHACTCVSHTHAARPPCAR